MQAAAPSPQRMLTPTDPSQSLISELSPLLMVVGAVLAVGLVLFLGVYWYKRGVGGEDAVAASHGGHHRGKRRRKRLHGHRPRNPTLAETGGLPPLRGDEQPPTAKP